MAFGRPRAQERSCLPEITISRAKGSSRTKGRGCCPGGPSRGRGAAALFADVPLGVPLAAAMQPGGPPRRRRGLQRVRQADGKRGHHRMIRAMPTALSSSSQANAKKVCACGGSHAKPGKAEPPAATRCPGGPCAPHAPQLKIPIGRKHTWKWEHNCNHHPHSAVTCGRAQRGAQCAVPRDLCCRCCSSTRNYQRHCWLNN